jgi:SAM-dependent MidA family methyltransferase
MHAELKLESLADVIGREIASGGAITFARFMELALYHPQWGYYESGLHQIGRGGDFYTSVSTGPLFGELLALKFASWLRDLPGEQVAVIEAGAHDGRLAADILTALNEHAPDVLARMQYWMVEPSARRHAAQFERLAGAFKHVAWASSFAELKSRRLVGVVFSNELFDALPVHRFRWSREAGQWREIGVALSGGRLNHVELPQRGSGNAGANPQVSAELQNVLPEGFVMETSPAREELLEEMAGSVEAGWMITVDYGGTREQLLSPARNQGTVRAFRQHHRRDDLLDSPGEQDLTAHVDFTQLIEAGHRLDWREEWLGSQARFLTGIAGGEAPVEDGFWSSARVRQFQTLIHPEHLGERFQVLVQVKAPPTTSASDSAVPHRMRNEAS